MREPDVRDERLGDLLDRAVAGVEPEDRSARVIRSGRRRQVVRAVGVITTAAVFVAAVAWVGSIAEEDAPEVPRHGPPALDDVRFEGPEIPWSFAYPVGWDARTYAQAGPELRVNSLITTVANGPIPGDDAFRPNSDDLDATRVFGEGGAIVSIERFWTHETSGTGAGEFGPGPFADDAQNPGWTFRERARCEGTLCWDVLEWLGPNVSDEDRAAAEAVADSVGLTDASRWTETDGARTTLHDEDRGFTFTYPNEGWRVADENLTPTLTQPEEIASIGTFNMLTSEDGDGLRIFDAPVAPAALASMDPTDAFVSLQESGVVEGAQDDRPERFAEGQEPEVLALDVPFDDYWIPFIDAGRRFYLFVAIGHDASPKTVDEAWAVADSLRFLAAPPA